MQERILALEARETEAVIERVLSETRSRVSTEERSASSPLTNDDWVVPTVLGVVVVVAAIGLFRGIFRRKPS